MTPNGPPSSAVERIAVGVDGSISSRAAVRWAIDHARDADTITLVHVWQASPTLTETGLVGSDDEAAARRFVDHEFAHANALPRRSGVRLTCEVLHGDPRDCLRQLDTDLLVVGARGQGGIAGLLLGSVSSYLARHARSPVVIVPCPTHKAANPQPMTEE